MFLWVLMGRSFGFVNSGPFIKRTMARLALPPPSVHTSSPLLSSNQRLTRFYSPGGASLMMAKPKRGSIVDSYQTVSVNCAKCGERLFRYKKKNGTKSNLIKCFVERIAEDCVGVLKELGDHDIYQASEPYACPSCSTEFARPAVIRGLPALKLVGGKTRMTKK